MSSIIDVDQLHASAARITGLSDFGDADYVPGLRVLIESYADEAELTELGEKVMRAFLRTALMARLHSEAGWRKHPSYEDVRVERPVFVTGLPRTGTTALHRLLAADPGHQGLELWLADAPQPRAQQPTVDTERYSARPDLAGIHHIAADQVEECWYLLRQSMMSISFECLAHVPSYSRWLESQDWTPAYHRHRRNLQLIGLSDMDKRWVLKNPSHLFALDALLDVYPDALIIQTHRDPATAIASVCSLNATASQGWSTLFDGDVVGRTQLELWARGLENFTTARAKHDPAQFMDVQYEEFVADPMRVIEHVYDRLGTPLRPQARAAMATALPTRSSSHEYSLADFGLTHDQVTARFCFT